MFEHTRQQTDEAQKSSEMVERMSQCVGDAAADIIINEKAAVLRKNREAAIDAKINDLDKEMAVRAAKEKDLREGVDSLKA